MVTRKEVCRRKEITLSQQKVGDSPRMEESRCEGCVVGNIYIIIYSFIRINSGVKHGCIMSPWLFYVYMDAVMKEVKWGMGMRVVRFEEEEEEEGREWRLPGLLYADELVLCGESEEDARAMVGRLLRCVGEEV